MKFTATIHVRPRPEVRDPQGDAVAAALRSIGLSATSARVGKEILVRYDAEDHAAALSDAERMGRELLANPVVEEFTVDLRTRGGDSRDCGARPETTDVVPLEDE